VFEGVLEWLIYCYYENNDNAAAAADAEAAAWTAILDRIMEELRRTQLRHTRWNASTGSRTELGDDESRAKVDQAMRSRLGWFRTFDHPNRAMQVVDAIRVNDFKRGRGGPYGKMIPTLTSLRHSP
jgi:hypothetical protein